eukprot:463613-Rhodomonas_salina.2
MLHAMYPAVSVPGKACNPAHLSLKPQLNPQPSTLDPRPSTARAHKLRHRPPTLALRPIALQPPPASESALRTTLRQTNPTWPTLFWSGPHIDVQWYKTKQTVAIIEQREDSQCPRGNRHGVRPGIVGRVGTRVPTSTSS